MANELIPASTVLLLRDAPSFEVLMVQRHADIGFAGGALVFPGGRIDDADAAPEWADLSAAWDQIPEEERAPRVAAIREAFEETGILLARNKDGQYPDAAFQDRTDSQRKPIEEDAALFLPFIQSEGLTLALDELVLFAKWQPPKSAGHRRYHTWFYAARAPERQSAREDGNEATEAIWTTTHAALAARDSGERKMIFPTSRNVELLGVSDSVYEAISFAHERRIETIEPEVEKRDEGAFLTIPTDMGYPITEEPLESAFRS